ncbi:MULTISPECIES: UTP--glucose-1-phosphate uridylyltransferase GalU [Micrococcaceae]|uniref:UTP--glucose-1-phosphate uridylyltransferase GalU n=1 Tax=Micrococcaceae TaxID=1268 RepID=UPI00161A316B|nr:MULTISPECIES: UTP--glucose-1-phosphate uridylyltransferase GalU [Micrococcaceae]MBB5748447.1 UTP--glucose-1-phosphate uridylyltransferase [Micrococcus sp. TA1]HRO30953.1 UTP--glucose-1-phosphate uridylyltransferase GalU [Citricoccus sp.]HRO93628.1 UTP--glucose-1-phosphate uridylyltransferase GalU [Citricoccus sp.]
MTSRSKNPRTHKAVIPAAGLGTRFLPATKAMPKEMLPVVDKPAIQYVISEARAAGLDDVLMVTGRSKRALEDHFDRVPALERTLELKGDFSKLDKIQEATNLGDIHFIRQVDPKGLGHAVLCAAQHVGEEPFAVLLGDDLIDENDNLLQRMIDVQQAKGGSVIALMEVPRENISAYGVAEVTAVEGGPEDVVKVTGLVEKPSAEDAPSNLAVIGRYVLDPVVFQILRRTGPGRGNEIQLTDALQVLAEGTGEGFGVHAVVFRGKRYDTGDKLSYLKAVIELASAREDLGPELRPWLKDFAASI